MQIIRQRRPKVDPKHGDQIGLLKSSLGEPGQVVCVCLPMSQLQQNMGLHLCVSPDHHQYLLLDHCTVVRRQTTAVILHDKLQGLNCV